MTLDLSLFTPEVLATFACEDSNIVVTYDVCELFEQKGKSHCAACPLYDTDTGRCVDAYNQDFLVKHFPELLI